MEKFFKPCNDFCNFYWDNGYAIIEKLIDFNDFDNILNAYENIKKSKITYFAMNTQNMANVQLNKNGYLKNPIADVAICDFINADLKEFALASRKLLSSEKIVEALNFIYKNENQYHAVMSMFFDANAGTPPHCDNYYLDSLPEGNLTAIWIALEDINPKAGRFFVIKESNKKQFKLSQSQIDNADEYENYMRKFVSENNNNLEIPSLKKGDVLFWNSKTVHGSTKTEDPIFSRKSYTCHYIPTSSKFVRNKYYPTVRSCKGIKLDNINFRFTSNVNKEEIQDSKQVGRSLKSFENNKK